MTQSHDDIRRLMIAINKIDGLYYFASRNLGVKFNTFALMYALADGEQHSQKQICEDWLIPRTTINTVVKECVEAGYVTLTALGNREKAVCLTEQGRAYADQVLKVVAEAEQEAMAKTTAEYSAEFVTAFVQFAEYFAEALAPVLGRKV